jgi:hypothetical protein
LKDEKFIFHDAHGRRWTRFKIFAFCASSLALLASILFVGSLFVAPPIAPPNSFSALKSQISNYERRGRAPQLTISDRILSRLLAEKAPAMKASTAPVSSDGVRAGFFADWDDAAFRSL